jgi:hypothetical protein
MAKLPEAYAKEKALKAIERQKKAEERKKLKEEQLKAQKELESSEEYIKEQIKKEEEAKKKKIQKLEQAKLERKNANPLVEILNEGTEIKEKEIKELKEIGTLKFENYGDEDKRRLVSVEVEKEKNGQIEIKDKQHSVRWTKKEKEFFNNQNELIKKFFFVEKSVPQYSKYICSCCGKIKNIEEFHKTYDMTNIARMDEGSQMHKHYCKDCAKKIFFYHYYHTCNKNEEMAMERFCCDTNTYWDVKIYLEARRVFENNPTSHNIVGQYIGALGRERVLGRTYWDSPTIKNRIFSDGNEIKDLSNRILGDFITPLDWKKEEAAVKKKIIRMLRYDPFATEREEDKKVMYRNLELMIDESMEDDYVKLQAAIEIVRSFQKIERLREKEQLLEQEGASSKELKEISALRNDELKQITNFSRDHGFAERYTIKKSKGAGTLTGCMNEMKENLYEPSLVNYYGVKTCKEMQETANISMESIFKQINLTENEVYDMLQTQTRRITDLTRQLDDLKEELRLTTIELKKQELMAKAKEKGIENDMDDINQIEDENNPLELNLELTSSKNETEDFDESFKYFIEEDDEEGENSNGD